MYRYFFSVLSSIFFIQTTQANCASDQYATITEAAAAAGNQFYRRSASEDREYMGGIIKSEDTYTFTVTAGVRKSDSVTARIVIPVNSQLVGLWHTHGSPHYSRSFFSEVDTQLVESMGVPFYLTDPEGRLSVYRPGDRTLTRQQSRRLGLPLSSGNAKGRTVKHSCRVS